MTLVTNLFGGPGVGKSTIGALTFGKLKQLGVNVELAPEYAKDLVWEGRHKALGYQPYIAAKQMYRIHRLMDQVDVIITDSPILFSLVYDKDPNWYWEQWLWSVFDSWDTLNIHLIRGSRKYESQGRTQATEEEAVEVDNRVDLLLKAGLVTHIRVAVGESASSLITELVMDRLGTT